MNFSRQLLHLRHQGLQHVCHSETFQAVAGGSAPRDAGAGERCAKAGETRETVKWGK